MKDIVPAVPAERHSEKEVFSNRKLIRPLLNHSVQNHSGANLNDRRERSNGGRKAAPPEQTNAENFYYQKQMQSKTPMVIVLTNNEEIHGVIEWYDRSCIKVNRVAAPNLMIYKPSIRYMYKEGELKK